MYAKIDHHFLAPKLTVMNFDTCARRMIALPGADVSDMKDQQSSEAGSFRERV